MPYKNKWPKYQHFAYYDKFINKWTRLDDDGYEQDYNVTHWMPLPNKPPNNE